MPRKATAKKKTSPQTEVANRPRRQSAKQNVDVASPSEGEERVRARRSSTAAQTAASVAEATRVTRSSRSQTANQANLSDRKSTSREASLEPTEVRSSGRAIKKVNYQESEGDDEESQAKKAAVVEEEDYNAEDDVENDSDSGDVGRNKSPKVKVRSPTGRSRGRPPRGHPLKEEMPTKVSPRGRRAKAEKKTEEEGENEADFVAPTRKGRYKNEEDSEETNVGRGRTSSRNTRPTRQAATPRMAVQRPTRTTRRQQSLQEPKDEDEENDEDQEEESKEMLEEQLSDDDDVAKKIEGKSVKRKRKAVDEPQTRKRQKAEEKSEDDIKVQSDEKVEEQEPMEVDEADTGDESKRDSLSSESTNKKKESKPDLDISKKEETKADEMNISAGIGGKLGSKGSKAGPLEDDTPEQEMKIEKESAKSSPVKLQGSVAAKLSQSSLVPNPKDEETASIKDAGPTPDVKKPGPTTEDEKRKNELIDQKKPSSVGGGEPTVITSIQAATTSDQTGSMNLVENDAKPKELQQTSAIRPTEGATFNGCEAPAEKSVPKDSSTTQDQPKAPLPSSNVSVISTGILSNSLCSATTNPNKESGNIVASNGVHCNQNLDSKARSRKYIKSSSVKDEERVSFKDRTFGFVSYNMSGDPMQASKSLLDFIAQANGIICLQDVSEEFYRCHLKSSFESQGYKVTIHIPLGQRTGLATLYKASCFNMKHHKGLALKDVISKDLEASVSSAEEKLAVNGHLKNCGHMLLTHLTFNDRPLTVANVSIPATDLGMHTLQISCVARETLNFLEGTCRPFLICGTFNMQENNAAYQLLRDGYLSNDMIELLQSKKDISIPGRENTALVNLLWKSFQHSAAALKSCYASVMGSEMKVHGQSTTLPDLMWYSSDCLKTLGILGNVENQELAPPGRLLLKADLAFSN